MRELHNLKLIIPLYSQGSVDDLIWVALRSSTFIKNDFLVVILLIFPSHQVHTIEVKEAVREFVTGE
jgi:hypothetical protein